MQGGPGGHDAIFPVKSGTEAQAVDAVFRRLTRLWPQALFQNADATHHGLLAYAQVGINPNKGDWFVFPDRAAHQRWRRPSQKTVDSDTLVEVLWCPGELTVVTCCEASNSLKAVREVLERSAERVPVV